MSSADHLMNQERFWNAEADSFDAIYGGDKSTLKRFLDRTLRRDMFQRYEFTMKHSAPIEGRAFLDVGCGSGRYSVALANQGAERVYGLDVSKQMLDLAREKGQAVGVDDRITWVHGDIDAFQHGPVDVTIAIGLFDYVRDPLPLLRKMCSVTTGSIIASFPRSNTWRAPVRKVRLGLRGCPVYFYSRHRLARLLSDASLRTVTNEQVGKLYCVVAEPTR